MKLVQLNVWWGGKLGYNIKEFLKEEAPDILCLQEAMSADKTDSLFYPVQRISKDAEFKYTLFSPLISYSFMQGKVSMGNAILSRKPITESFTMFTNLEHTEDFDFFVHDYNVRNLVHAKIKNGNKTINVLTHHGHHVPHHKEGNKETDRQCREIANYIKDLSGPVILTGDFNLSPHSKSLKPLNDMLENLPVKHKSKTTRNFLTHKQEVCDYIFINGKVKEKHFEVSEKIVSDHAALILEFDI
ncbi:endonuclease/exonuclease/phosphatase family protein [Candidatus Saccharibacteria bacterium]|nr:endonuclease/exonuclease/phosphatase family protein [Candidatus Saccharibacteria bacterium]